MNATLQVKRTSQQKWIILGEDSMREIQSQITGCISCQPDEAWTRISYLIAISKSQHWTRRYFYIGNCSKCGSQLTEKHCVSLVPAESLVETSL